MLAGLPADTAALGFVTESFTGSFGGGSTGGAVGTSPCGGVTVCGGTETTGLLPRPLTFSIAARGDGSLSLMESFDFDLLAFGCLSVDGEGRLVPTGLLREAFNCASVSRGNAVSGLNLAGAINGLSFADSKAVLVGVRGEIAAPLDIVRRTLAFGVLSLLVLFAPAVFSFFSRLPEGGDCNIGGGAWVLDMMTEVGRPRSHPSGGRSRAGSEHTDLACKGYRNVCDSARGVWQTEILVLSGNKLHLPAELKIKARQSPVIVYVSLHLPRC